MSNTNFTPYKDSLTDAMTLLAKENFIFVGQQIIYPGNPMSTTLGNVPKENMIETPVMEETQMGMSLGLAMTGKNVVTFYPRWDFIIVASNQLINSVDKYSLMTGKPINLLIRLGKGSDKPLDPGHQHKNNYINEFRSMCKHVTFHDLKTSDDIVLGYQEALKGGIHCLVEYPELYYV